MADDETTNRQDMSEEQIPAQKVDLGPAKDKQTPVYEKPRLRKYDQIDHVAIYGVD